MTSHCYSFKTFPSPEKPSNLHNSPCSPGCSNLRHTLLPCNLPLWPAPVTVSTPFSYYLQNRSPLLHTWDEMFHLQAHLAIGVTWLWFHKWWAAEHFRGWPNLRERESTCDNADSDRTLEAEVLQFYQLRRVRKRTYLQSQHCTVTSNVLVSVHSAGPQAIGGGILVATLHWQLD